MSPAINGPPTPTSIHWEYSEESDPRQTGIQYMQKDIINGARTAAIQRRANGRVKHDRNVSNAELIATRIANPERVFVK